MIRTIHALTGPIVLSIFLALGFAAPHTARADGEASDATAKAAEQRARPEHPLAAGIVELHEAARARLDALGELRRGALDAEAIRRVEAAIARTKLDFEIDVLELQRGQQAALGRAAATEELGRAILALKTLRDDIDVPDLVLPETAEDQREGGE